MIRVCVEVTQRGLTLADVGVPQVPVLVLVVERRTLLTLSPNRVVLTVIAHASAHVARRHVRGHVEMTRRGMLVTLALCKRRRQCASYFSLSTVLQT